MLTKGTECFLHSLLSTWPRSMGERRGSVIHFPPLDVWIENQPGLKVFRAPRAFWICLAKTLTVPDVTVPSLPTDGDSVLHQ